uniref:DUF834 domain-containing protein n=1 Tax=Oryza rufipogon TaxID=4529 RepID=A0A0E0NZE9_ORYRU
MMDEDDVKARNCIVLRRPPCRSKGSGDTGGDHRRLPPSSASPPLEQTARNRAAARKVAAGPSFSLEVADRCPRPRPDGGGDGVTASASVSGWARGGSWVWNGWAWRWLGAGAAATTLDLAPLARSGGLSPSRDDGDTQGGGEGRWQAAGKRWRLAAGERPAPRQRKDRRQAGAVSQ